MTMQPQHDFIFGATPVKVITLKPEVLETRVGVPLLFNGTYPDFPRGGHSSSNVDKYPNVWSRMPTYMLSAYRQHLHERAGISHPCGNDDDASPTCEMAVLIKRGEGYGANSTVRLPRMGLFTELSRWSDELKCGDRRAADRAKWLVRTKGLWPLDAKLRVMRECPEVFFPEKKHLLLRRASPSPGACIGACSRSLPQEFYDEAEKYLGQRGIKYTIAVLETMDLEEQVRLFAEAKLVIGQHGAGLSNLVASSPRTRVVEVGPVNFPCYKRLAEKLLQDRVETDCTEFCDEIKDVVDQVYGQSRVLSG